MDVSAILVPIASAVLSVLAAVLSVGANNRKLRAEAQAIDVQSLRETLGQLERHRIIPEWRPGQRHSSRKREVKL